MKVEVFYDESLAITMRDEKHILLHYVTKRLKGYTYVAPIGSRCMVKNGYTHRPRGRKLAEPPEHMQPFDSELLPLLPSWVPVEWGKAFNRVEGR